jgi:hypothetical protein
VDIPPAATGSQSPSATDICREKFIGNLSRHVNILPSTMLGNKPNMIGFNFDMGDDEFEEIVRISELIPFLLH